jgi:hypothetical protein
MSANLQTLPDRVRTQARTMRDLLNTIQNGPLEKSLEAIVQMNGEIDKLIALANEASGRRI